MITLHVKEMSCEHCVARISKALEAAEIKYQVDLGSKTVAVEESEVSHAIEELDDLGFTAVR